MSCKEMTFGGAGNCKVAVSSGLRRIESVMIKPVVFLALTVSLVAQQILPEPNPVGGKREFKPDQKREPAVKAAPPLPPPPPKFQGPAVIPPREAANALGEAELKSVIETLRGSYVRPDDLEEIALARARLQGLLERAGTASASLRGRVLPAMKTSRSARKRFRIPSLTSVSARCRRHHWVLWMRRLPPTRKHPQPSFWICAPRRLMRSSSWPLKCAAAFVRKGASCFP